MKGSRFTGSLFHWLNIWESGKNPITSTRLYSLVPDTVIQG